MKHTNQIGNLPKHKNGPNKGRLNRVRAAQLLGVSNSELHKAYNNWVQLFRIPGCTLTLEQYFLKMEEAGISPDDLGLTQNSYNLARINDEGPYTNESCRFIKAKDNHKEQKKITPFQHAVNKFGYEEASRLNSVNATKAWKRRKSEGCPCKRKTDAHKKQLSISMKLSWVRRKISVDT